MASHLCERNRKVAASVPPLSADWNFALYRILLATTWYASDVSETPEGTPCVLSTLLGAEFDATSVCNRLLRPAANLWSRFAHGGSDSMIDAWARAVDEDARLDHTVSRTDYPRRPRTGRRRNDRRDDTDSEASSTPPSPQLQRVAVAPTPVVLRSPPPLPLLPPVVGTAWWRLPFQVGHTLGRDQFGVQVPTAPPPPPQLPTTVSHTRRLSPNAAPFTPLTRRFPSLAQHCTVEELFADMDARAQGPHPSWAPPRSSLNGTPYSPLSPVALNYLSRPCVKDSDKRVMGYFGVSPQRADELLNICKSKLQHITQSTNAGRSLCTDGCQSASTLSLRACSDDVTTIYDCFRFLSRLAPACSNAPFLNPAEVSTAFPQGARHLELHWRSMRAKVLAHVHSAKRIEVVDAMQRGFAQGGDWRVFWLIMLHR